MKPLLKRIETLTPQDFRNFPVWVSSYAFDQEEVWHHEVDEATYRPWTGALPVVDKYMSPFALSTATFRLNDGTELAGFAVPPFPDAGAQQDHISVIQPAIFLPSGGITWFWRGIAIRQADLRHFYDAVHRTATEVFPISFKIDAKFIGNEFVGSVPGFCAPSPHDKATSVTR